MTTTTTTGAGFLTAVARVKSPSRLCQMQFDQLLIKKLAPNDSYAWKEATAQPASSLRPNNVDPTDDVHVGAPLAPSCPNPRDGLHPFRVSRITNGASREVITYSFCRHAPVIHETEGGRPRCSSHLTSPRRRRACSCTSSRSPSPHSACLSATHSVLANPRHAHCGSGGGGGGGGERASERVSE